MSSENVELVRTALQAFNREGIDAIAPGIHPDFETTTPSSLAVEPDTYRGMEGIRRWMDAWGDTMDEVRFEADELIDGGERVVAVCRLVTRSATTGIELEQRVAMVWTLRDGLAVRLDPYATRDEALRAAGIAA
jgi:ketosteroid isomerase-like protein